MNKSVKSEPKEEAPWKVRVTVTKNENEVDVKHEEEEYDLLNPWTTMIKREREPESEDDQEEAEMQMPSAPAKHPSQTANHDQEEALPQTPEEPPGQKEMQEMMASINSQDSPWSHLLRVQNYAAMEASFGNFGLIPMGVEKGMRSLIVHVKGLEDEKTKLMQLLETERERLKEAQAKADKMSEGKRNEMRQALDTVIMTWLQDAVKDEKVREEFKQGMNRLVETTAEDSGVWQVVCQASSVHAQKMQEIERFRLENEELRSKGTGDFRDEGSRKRPREETEAVHTDGNVWAEFENEIRSGRTFGLGV